MRFASLPGLLAAALLGIGCHDVTGPDPGTTPGTTTGPVFSHAGTGPAFHGVGSIGEGAATPGAGRQDFDFDIVPDLRTGTLVYRDWSVVRANGTTATVTVSTNDSFTAIATFRDGSAACADPTRGAEFDGYGRLDDGGLVRFTVVACDNGPGGSGADWFRISLPNAGYQREGLLSSGDVAKSGPFPQPASPQVTGLGWIGPGRPTPESYGKNFDFEATAAPGGRLAYIDYEAIRPDGSRGTFTVNSETDPATRVTSYHQNSSTCVRFAGTGRVDTGELWAFYIDACDNASPGTGFDTFGLNVPNLFVRSGTLTDGDIILGSPAPTTGDLNVAAATTGESLDPDGYTVTVDETTSQAVPTNGSVTFTGLSAGSHSVALSGVASNCAVSGGNSQTITVSGGATASATFSVSCTALPGDLTVSVSTSGVNLDPDGYTVTVDGTDARPLPINGTVTYTNLSAGNHVVALSGLAANCTVSGGNSQTVAVLSGGTASTAFAVTCEAGPATRLVFTVQPSNTRANSTIQPAVQVTALDAQGNRATTFNGSVTIAIGRNGGGLLTPGTLSGTRTVSAVNGVATFSDLSIDRSGEYTLRVSASGLTGAESAAFQIESSTVCLLGICL